MPTLPVSIVVVPRERFSDSIASLESLYANTPMPCEMIYVDGNSPEPIKSLIERWASEKKLQLIRSENYLSPNQARNIGSARAKNKYIAFVDNDLRVTPGWLERLVACAEETGAWVVSPLYLEGKLEEQIIHTAGGPARFVSREGKRAFHEEHRFYKQKLDSVRQHLRREPTEFVEFHAVLVRAEYFETTGPLDEKLLSMAEHLDFSLCARERGYKIYTEPSSVVGYSAPLLTSSDLEYFLLRWSDHWARLTVERLQEKWNLSADDSYCAVLMDWVKAHRESNLSASGFEKFVPSPEKFEGALFDQLDVDRSFALMPPSRTLTR
jgi:GT2 family glycosyltransferase